MKSPKKMHKSVGAEFSLRLRETQKEEPIPELSDQQTDDDTESELPIRGRPSKKLLIQQQQQRQIPVSQYQVKLQPELNAVTAGATALPNRSKVKRALYKKSGSGHHKTPGESYVMRLFERSLDLSKYNEKTPLYPICRAWMANQPRNPAVSTYNTEGSTSTVKRESDAEEVLAKLKSGEIKILTHMPKPRSTDLPVVPPRLEYTKEEKLQHKKLEGAAKDDLLSANMARWKRVRDHWEEHTQKYNHERYEVIDQIMHQVSKIIK
ncbi:GL16832 [Drosophila persimilis]|uniref:GL16832 n=1 Tax=Drosophila persimilis TaxID=7234 RepID=B4GI30_DROPE|nr:protein lin-37 homolog [Drosophila persimilis]EDW36150.1 GL16832 [Drosophila persimilis]